MIRDSTAARRRGLKFALPLVALLALVAGTVVGCGGDDDSDSDGGQASTAPAGATATRETTAVNEVAADLQAIEYPGDRADGMALGNADAPATLELFEDFQCPFCLRFTANWEELLMEYVEAGKLRLVFRNLPILGPESVYAAAAGVCAAEQEGFWDYHRQLFLVQAEAAQHENEQLNVGRFAPDALVGYAEEAGLDGTAFATCLQDPATLTTVQDDVNAARTAGLNSTPSLVLDGEQVGVPTSEGAWRELLDEATQ